MFAPSGDLAIAEDLSAHKTWVVKVPGFERLAAVAASDASHRILAISADEQTLAVGDAAGNVRIWSLPSGAERISVRPSLKWGTEFFHLGLSPDGSKLFWIDGHLLSRQAIDTHSGKLVDWPADMRFLNHAPCVPSPIICSPDARQIAVSDVDSGVRVVDIRDSGTGEVLHRLRYKDRLTGHIAWSPDGSRLAASTVNDTLVLFDPIRGEQVAELDGCLEPSIAGLQFDASGQSIRTFTAGPYFLGRSSWRAPRQTTPHAK
jgi:WD40 repeat protein